MATFRRLALAIGVTIAAFPASTHAQGSGRSTRPSREQMLRAMQASKERADSAASRVTRLLVTPRTLHLSVGDSVYSRDLYAKLDVIGVTAEGDTLRDFVKGFMLLPSQFIEQRGSDLVARHPGEATLWVVVGSDMKVDMRDTTRAVRIPIQVH